MTSSRKYVRHNGKAIIGTEPCPGSGDEAQNAVTLVTQPTLEDGVTLNNPAILINPNTQNGFVRGTYPEYLVQPGDHFQAIASCEANADNLLGSLPRQLSGCFECHCRPVGRGRVL